MHEKQAEASAADDQVRLKPFLGLRPGKWLAALYSLALLIILFFVLIYPGIANPGSVVALQTEPSGAALRVDGVYRGTAPDRVFIPRGNHTLELVLPGFAAERIECEIPGRLFASALFPRRYPLTVTLRAPDRVAAFAAAAADYAEWTFGGEPTASWQIPLSLSEGAYRLWEQDAEKMAANGAAADAILKASARFAVTRASLRDLLRAKVLADNGGLAPSPASLFNSAADVIRFLVENPGSASWLAELLPAESAALVTASAWYRNQRAAADKPAAPAPASGKEAPARQLRAGGLTFTGVDGGTLIRGEPFPHAVSVRGFMICDTAATSSAFEAFLAANPRWRAERRDELVKEELASADYLVDDGNAAVNAITAVSWFAANAFCEWLNGQLPPSMAGCEARLPTEAEWEYAAKTGAGGGAAPASGVWEWCADPYAPLPFFAAAPEAEAAVGSPERSLRGGSWLNTGGVTPETRGSLPPAYCSPFVSFRPVIAFKETSPAVRDR